jgi:hypothetical protein
MDQMIRGNRVLFIRDNVISSQGHHLDELRTFSEILDALQTRYPTSSIDMLYTDYFPNISDTKIGRSELYVRKIGERLDESEFFWQSNWDKFLPSFVQPVNPT